MGTAPLDTRTATNMRLRDKSSVRSSCAVFATVQVSGHQVVMYVGVGGARHTMSDAPLSTPRQRLAEARLLDASVAEANGPEAVGDADDTGHADVDDHDNDDVDDHDYDNDDSEAETTPDDRKSRPRVDAALLLPPFPPSRPIDPFEALDDGYLDSLVVRLGV
jgi:hypothetical protein